MSPGVNVVNETAPVAPRPSVASIAPRPVAPPEFSAKADVALQKFRAMQEAGTKQARRDVRRSFEGAPPGEAADKAAADEQRRLKQERLLRAKTEPARIAGETEINVQELKNAGEKAREELAIAKEEMRIGADLKMSENVLQAAGLTADASRSVAETNAASDAEVQRLKNKATPTAQDQLRLAQMEGFAKDKAEAIVGIADMSTFLNGTETDTPILRGITALQRQIAASNRAQQEIIASSEEASQQATATQAGQADLDGDGVVSPQEKRFNRLDAQLKRKDALLKAGVTAAEIEKLEGEHQALKKQIRSAVQTQEA